MNTRPKRNNKKGGRKKSQKKFATVLKAVKFFLFFFFSFSFIQHYSTVSFTYTGSMRLKDWSRFLPFCIISGKTRARARDRLLFLIFVIQILLHSHTFRVNET